MCFSLCINYLTKQEDTASPSCVPRADGARCVRRAARGLLCYYLRPQRYDNKPTPPSIFTQFNTPPRHCLLTPPSPAQRGVRQGCRNDEHARHPTQPPMRRDSASLPDATYIIPLVPTRLHFATLRCGGWGYDDSACSARPPHHRSTILHPADIPNPRV